MEERVKRNKKEIYIFIVISGCGVKKEMKDKDGGEQTINSV